VYQVAIVVASVRKGIDTKVSMANVEPKEGEE
jgi:hypothetical protein